MKTLLYFSDDYFFCTGMNESSAEATLVASDSIINKKIFFREDQIPIVTVNNLKLRLQVIKKIQSKTKEFIVMLDEIEPKSFFRLGCVFFCGNLISHHRIFKLFSCKYKARNVKFTAREKQVLYNIHYQNGLIAENLNLSIKTVSHYKLSVLEKLRVISKNNINVIRLKLTLDEACFSTII